MKNLIFQLVDVDWRNQASCSFYVKMKIKKRYLLRCPLCSSESIKVVTITKDFETHSGIYSITLCLSCGIHFTNPQPSKGDIYLLYKSRDTSDFPRMNSLTVKLRSFNIRRQLDWLISILRIKEFTALDFGCGDGLFSLQVAARKDCASVVATDFHDEAPILMRNEKKLEYIPYEKYMNHDRKYDIIFCRHVLEHQSDPACLLHDLKSLLSSGGHLIVDVPNYNSAWRRIFLKYYYPLYVPRHIFHFDERSFKRILTDFTIIKIGRSHTPIIGNSLRYLTGMPVSNTGFIGLAFYPFQIVLDILLRQSTVLTVVAKNE